MKQADGIFVLSLIAYVAMVSATVGAESAVTVDFAREILPILSNKCFVCHGPDTVDEEQLRLDSFTGATADRGGYRAIDPDSLEESEILVRIQSADDPMPPEDADKQLTDGERALLERWVRQGGTYARHWAYVPPQKREPPEDNLASGSQAIDAFVHARLRARGTTFAAEADRPTLARRVALVLTGLPPELDELRAFLNDKRDDAYERFVERLFNNPRYGEHQARYWLDAVRYGDTHGLHLDNRRGIYPYRDWVVHALNNNLPLDEFITWQIAGDLLPAPTLAQRVATGFVRMNPTTSEGGAIAAEFQAKNNFDRTETLGTVLLGATLTCARCHTHKYDPIPQTEYYRLLAFFNSTAEDSMDGNSYTYGPVVKAPANQAAWSEWETLESELDALLAQARAKVETADQVSEVLAHAEARGQWKSDDWRISKALDVEDTPDEADWQEAQGLPGVSKVQLPESQQAIWVSFRIHTPLDQALWLTFSGGHGSRVFFLGDDSVQAAYETTVDQSMTRLGLTAGTHHVRIKMVGTKAGTQVEARLTNPWQAVVEANDWNACDKWDQLLILSDPQGPFAHLQLQERAQDLALRVARASHRFTTTLVAEDLESKRATRVLRRGEYDSPMGDELEPGVLTVMGPFPEGAPRNRLGLARWLTSRDHPLVARVLINRVWQRTFGEGLVRSPEDFGLQGEQPTHPELLDWLAVELHESGWDLKHMLRIMVMSRTFRQDSAYRADIDDPENRLLARGPRHRLDAEAIRDIGLWASGLLDPVMGGEGVKPYQPDGMWLAMAHPASNTKRYVRDKGRLLYRRSLYVYWKRTSPHPMMTLFDAPDRESSCVRRSRTSTSLQSLALLNETQRIEMARGLAERLLCEAPDDDQRLNLLFRLLASRDPTAAERSACIELLEETRRRYADSEQDAIALLSIGDNPRNKALNPSEQAAWSQVAITVLASELAIMLY